MSGATKLARKRSGVMGINRRNLEYVSLNPRRNFALADDKVLAKDLMSEAGVPVPETIAVVRYHAEIHDSLRKIEKRRAFAAKPVHGFGGQGLLVCDRQGATWATGSGRGVTENDITFHLAAILSGNHSLMGETDQALIEVKVTDHPDFSRIHGDQGLSDIRVIVCESALVMGMLRLPCKSSGGAANLHAGGIGVGIDMTTGVTTSAVQGGRPLSTHPDTGISLAGHRVPGWRKILDAVRPMNRLFGMDYLGVDVVIDAFRGPLVLEVNARPGLEIQLANRKGLLHALGAKN